jgi:hypothetical protein
MILRRFVGASPDRPQRGTRLYADKPKQQPDGAKSRRPPRRQFGEDPAKGRHPEEDRDEGSDFMMETIKDRRP